MTWRPPEDQLNRFGIVKRQHHAHQHFPLVLRLNSLHLRGFEVIHGALNTTDFAPVFIRLTACDGRHQAPEQLLWIVCRRRHAARQPDLSPHASRHELTQSLRGELRHRQLHTAPLRLQVGSGDGLQQGL